MTLSVWWSLSALRARASRGRLRARSDELLGSLLVTFALVATTARADLPPSEELVQIERALAQHPDDVRLVLAHAEASIEAGAPARALEDTALAAALAPRDSAIAAVRAEALVALDRREDALAELDRARGRGLAGPQGLALRARLLAREGRTAESVEAWDEILAAWPDPDGYLERSALLARLGRTSEALESEREGLAVTGSAALRVAVIDRAVALGEHEIALDALAPWIEPRAGGARGRWLLRAAEILRAARREREATARFEEAERALAEQASRRPSAATLVDHGRALLALGRHEEAERQARRALALRTRSPQATALVREIARARGAR